MRGISGSWHRVCDYKSGFRMVC
ncbi:unnamed protein product [Ectocarpus sp. CCAP 1310/34]|nr:unnamed protein product [Ectocarpus sp. CCAP 1310/34]